MESPASTAPSVSRTTTLAPLFAQSPAEKQQQQQQQQQQALAPLTNSGNTFGSCLSPSHTGRGLDTTSKPAAAPAPVFLPVAPSPLSQTQLQFTQSQYATKRR